MAYLKYSEFNAFNTGVAISIDEFVTLEQYASTDIESLTFPNRINEANLPTIKKAVAFQIAYLYMNGGIEAASSGASLKSEKIGNYTYNIETANRNAASGYENISPAAIKIIYPTGLLYRGVSRCGKP